ncbi:substrate-binding domain-containing protein [Pseudomonas panipatensis]|jgi:hypothetical protein|uniref:Extracellular solute-binding protein n=1 Tax=Pseudomonas panipatensis TaxID=428992 RepID=A0A1G8JBM2_9PSED|nr:substrate-binding domain-containing protein [Pseudomonas panipatensis]SDI28586.1 extracellular solute-binding protein [Pseudomonas panipatensis]SMP50641.1 extracellular solute-binding protein [Pseudomonas panipatensis]
MRRPLALLCLCLLALLPTLGQATPDVLRVASGNESMPALAPLVDQYQADTGNKVLLIQGDSATLATEIAQGAAFDLFFSDDGSARQLNAQGLGEPAQTYACKTQPRQYTVLVQGPRHVLAERFLAYLRAHRETLRQAGYQLPSDPGCGP